MNTLNYQGRPSNNQFVQNQVIAQSNQFYTQNNIQSANNIGLANLYQNTPQYLNSQN